MASYNELNALIDAYINRNGVQAITGQILNGVLKAMVEQLGRGYTIMGAATPTTDPGTPDGPECYFASAPGTYTDFDGLQIVPGELALLCYTPTDGWTKETIYEGFQEVQATIDENVGTPSVGVSYANGVLSFDFHNMKGNPGQNGQDGQDGDAAGFGTIGADITGGVGTPGVTVDSSGPATAKNLQFHFTNLKGETGVTSVVATVDNTTGNPACTVSLVGQQLTLAFSGLKGAQGDTGSSVDYPFTIVNNLTTDDATQALSAAQGVVLQGEITQLEHEVVKNKTVIGANLFNKSSDNIISGYIGTNGYASGDAYRMTHPIAVVSGVTYKFPVQANQASGRCAAYCSEDGTFIESFYGTVDSTTLMVTFTADRNGYVRANIGSKNNLDTYMFCESANYPDIYTPYSFEYFVGDIYGLGEKQVEQVGDIIKPLNQEVFDLPLVANSAYDSANGKTVTVNGYYRTDKLPYDEAKVLEFSPSSAAVYASFWNGDTYQGQGSVGVRVSPFVGTTHCAFHWTSTVDKATYTDLIKTSNVVDNLVSSESKYPLSAKQGKELKQLIDQIEPVITIEGSGVAKNASAYGFLPTATADENAEALQSCLNGGGLILIDIIGTYKIGSTIFVDSNTKIVCAPGVILKRAVSESNNTIPQHIFVNRGAQTRTYNENISLVGLNIVPDQSIANRTKDTTIAVGLRGLVAMFYVKNLVIDGLTVVDHDYTQYTLHICTFDNVQLRNIHIETLKDGVHFGRGRGFILEHCQFLTNDDAIALNAVDYPGSNAEAGWIEDGIIKDIVFLAKPVGGAFEDKRGVLLLTGAWKDWTSGNTYKTCGDYCVNNGRLYQTNGATGTASGNYLVSSYAPTHASGSVTYEDGLTWLMKQDQGVGYDAGVRRITFEDIYFYRKVGPAFLFSSELSSYMRAFYPGASLYKNTDIRFSGIHFLSESASRTFMRVASPIDRIMVDHSDFGNLDNTFITLGTQTDVPTDMNVNFSFIGNNYANISFLYNDGGEWDATINVVGSFRNGHALTYNGITPTVINNDMV